MVGRRFEASRVLLVGAVVLATVGVLAGSLFGMEPGDRLWPLAWVIWAPIGALILWRRPGNGVGTTMVAIGLCWGAGFVSELLARTTAPLGVRVWSELVSLLMGALPWLGIIWLLLIFPTGRLHGRMERITGLALVALAVMAVVSFAASPHPMDLTGAQSPLAVSWLASLTTWFVSESGFFIVTAVILAAIVALALRWRTSSGIERHQYRWLLLGALIFVSILGIGQILPDSSLGGYTWIISGMAIPVAVGIAVSRYRLFEIDRIISRTVTYALVVGLLGLLVAGVAAIAGSQFETPWIVAATTLGVAASFNPLRTRMQVWVDRRFNRSKYDAERVVAEFAGSLREHIDTDEVVDGWLGVVDSTMQPAAVGVWIKGAS